MSSVLSRLLSAAANGGFVAAGLPDWLRFRRARTNLAVTQQRILERILVANSQTCFGKAHDFSSISSAREYLEAVPPASYDSLLPYIDRIKAGEENVLTAERVHMFELSSGSAAASKYIPYTATLLAEFQAAVGAWLVDLYWHHPGLLVGRAYWCITPLTAHEKKTSGGVAIGMEDDGAYFGALRQWFLSKVLVVPRDVASLQSRDNFRYATLLFLLAADDLVLLSLWSPTFLTTLFEPLARWQEQLAEDLEAGTLTVPEAEDAALVQRLVRCCCRRPARAALLRTTVVPSRLWPRMTCLSAWGDWVAGDFVSNMTAQFPEAYFQPKGLLATEGVVSFPLVGEERGTVLAASSHFFDFQDDQGQARLAHELEEGGQYVVNLTTGGGLYRYRLGDRVAVTGFVDELPVLRFVGRVDLVCDWFGEKLNEGHVRKTLDTFFASDERPPFAMLAMEKIPRPRYVLWLEKGAASLRDDAAAELDRLLSENHHYRHCRRLGQLEALEIVTLADGEGLAAVSRRARVEDRREGGLKPVLLDRRTDWQTFFRHG